MNYYLKVLKQYKNFDGRTARKEYWMFVLFNFIISILLATVDQIIFSGNEIFSLIYALFIFIPGLAVNVRRLHDIGKSGWMQLVILIPFVGWIWFLILMIKQGDDGINQYGESIEKTRF